jgi:hypothetical protein
VSYPTDTVVVSGNPSAFSLTVSKFTFFSCGGFPPTCSLIADYDISSAQGFTNNAPARCSDTSGATPPTSLDCTPIPALTSVTGSPQADTITSGCDFFGAARIAVFAGEGADTVGTGCGDDTLDGAPGDDELDSGSGNDTVNGGDGDDTVSGGAGIDALSGGAGDDAVQAGSQDDVVGGDAGADTLAGGDGADQRMDTVSYEDRADGTPLRNSLNGAADDGGPGEADAIAADIENVIGSPGADTIAATPARMTSTAA